MEYARKYAIAPNPCYRTYANDCTNFVSQALKAGGWTESGGSVFDRKDDGVWWYGESLFSTASYTWAGGHNFFSKFVAQSGRGVKCAREELMTGDVVQIARDGHVFHTMIVTAGQMCSVKGNDVGPLMSYHTNNTLDKDLGTIEGKYAASPFLYWRIRDEFKS